MAERRVDEERPDLERILRDYEDDDYQEVGTIPSLVRYAQVLEEALREIVKRGVVFDAKGTWSKQVNEIARRALRHPANQDAEPRQPAERQWCDCQHLPEDAECIHENPCRVGTPPRPEVPAQERER